MPNARSRLDAQETPSHSRLLLMGRSGFIALVAIGALGLAVAAGLSSAQPGHPPPQAPPRGLTWVMARSSLENLGKGDEGAAARALNAPRTLVQSDLPLRVDPSPAGWSTTSAAHWTSYAQFAADVAAGAVPAYIKVAHYDNESWSQTPESEQAHPAAFERRFCSLAHADGWSCLSSPAQDLCGVLAHPHGDNYAHCYLDLDLAGKAARVADLLDIQAQALEPLGARSYANFVRVAAAQARRANPQVRVLGNLSPTPDGREVPARTIFRCARAALPYLDGFYLTVPEGQGAKMLAVVKLIAAAG